jgi:hypothetical protein
MNQPLLRRDVVGAQKAQWEHMSPNRPKSQKRRHATPEYSQLRASRTLQTPCFEKSTQRTDKRSLVICTADRGRSRRLIRKLKDCAPIESYTVLSTSNQIKSTPSLKTEPWKAVEKLVRKALHVLRTYHKRDDLALMVLGRLKDRHHPREDC